jgi:8-oxo-dGTP pyrophosphatase MutT (NUDIX family)
VGIPTSNEEFLFVVQEQNEWQNDTQGGLMVPFGGIGGKVEDGENLYEALEREFQEEVATSVQAVSSPFNTALFVRNELQLIQSNELMTLPVRPLFVCLNPYDRPGHKSQTNIFAFACTIPIEDIRPGDNPAVIAVSRSLLKRLVTEVMTVREAEEAGLRILAGIRPPPDAIFMALPTPRCLDKYLDGLTKQEVKQLFGLTSGGESSRQG